MRDSHWIRSLSDLPIAIDAAVVTLGSFDGVHLGHRSLIEHLRSVAAARRSEVVIITFHPHPMHVLRGEHEPRLITTYEERARRLFEAGADWVVDLPFDAVRNMAAEEFVQQILLDGVRATYVLAGPDTRFGHGRTGDSQTLSTLGELHGFTVEVADTILQGATRISSTRIRTLVADEGDVGGARELLGRPHRVTGRVVHGAKRGRELGFPTANLAPMTSLLPTPGIYAAQALCESGARYPAAVSVGHNPTFGANDLTVEAYLLDFSGDLYEQTLSIDFYARLRGEVAFDSVDALITQMQHDVDRTRALISDEAG